MCRLLLILAAAAVAAPSASSAGSKSITVAAAGNLKVALDEVIARFKAREPSSEVRATYGASGTFFALIQNGAPYDLFLSAEESMPQKLVETDQALGAAFTYAFGKLVLWVPKGSKLDIERQGAKALLDASVQKIAIGNPSVAPYGVAAESAMKSAGVHDALKGKVVLGQNIQQAAQFAQSGNAQAAFLPLSLVIVPPLSGDGRYVTIPANDYKVIEQVGVALKTTRQPALTKAFTAYLLGPDGRAVLEKYGYGLPPARQSQQ